MEVRGERAKDGEALVQRGVLFHQLVDEGRHVLLLHHEDEVLLVRLKDDGEEEKGGGFLVSDPSIAEHVSFLVDQEVSTRKHDQLREDLGSAFSLHKDRVENGDCFQPEGETLTECEELNINLRVLDVELAEVSDVVTYHLL